jgi:hypothetical protein
MRVVDQGEDGAILEDDRGNRVYAHDWEQAGPDEPGENDSRIPMRKPLVDGVEVFAKALKDRPGLTLQPVMDRHGRQTKWWKRSGQKLAGSEDRPFDQAPSGKADDHIRFRTVDGEVSGTIIGTPGKDGAHVQGDDGKEHKVLWDDVVGDSKGDAKKAASMARRLPPNRHPGIPGR